MKKCRAVMMGAVVLSGLVFSSTEARADETITDIMDVVAGMERFVSDFRASARADMENPNTRARAMDTIKKIHNWERMIFDKRNTAKAIEMATDDNERFETWRRSGKRGEKPKEYDVAAWNKKIGNERKSLEILQEMIEKYKLENLTPEKYDFYLENARANGNDIRCGTIHNLCVD
ncbi:hypothetical protein AGMMS49990_09320 [Endomicrobiia bacterium]|nr:hypothetical protein AGMMS49990_09320 [Endomicrobiia bacterium]